MNSIQEFLEYNAEKFSDKTAIVYKDKSFSYHEFNETCNQCAQALFTLGVQKGDRIVISTKNKLLEAIFCFGILKVGAVEVAIDCYDKTKDIKDIVKKIDARLLVADKIIVDGEKKEDHSTRNWLIGGAIAIVVGGIVYWISLDDNGKIGETGTYIDDPHTGVGGR